MRAPRLRVMTGSLVGAALRRHRRPAAAGRLLVAAPVLAFVVAACSSASGAPAYTYAPTASDPGVAAAGSPSDGPMAMPSAGSPGTGSSAPASAPAQAPSAAAPSGAPAPAGATVHLSAQNIQFDTAQLSAPAGQPWALTFANNDAGVPHNVEIRDATGASVFKGQIVTGPTTVTYQVPALSAGSYTFLCDVHPTMTGTLTVG